MPVYNVNSVNIKRKERWYFGGLACCLVTFLVHPLDTIKVHLQTHQGKNISIFTVGKHIVHEGGVVALYNGLSASLMRQVVYSGTRFALYGSVRNALTQGGRIQSFWEKVAVAAGCGAIGACGATPFDLINVRMQNDIKLPPEQRRNYTWVGNAFVRLLREEGFKRAFGGASFVAVRGACMTVGQIAFYDTVKQAMLRTKYFNDTIGTHFASSIVAAFAATVLTQPLDVIKTRVMQAKPGELRGYIHAIIVTSHQGPTAFMKGMSPSALRIVPGTIAAIATLLTQPFDVIKTRIQNAQPGRFSGYLDVIKHTAMDGPFAFFKGLTPAFIRIAPATIGTFIMLEQFTTRFGIIEKDDGKKKI